MIGRPRVAPPFQKVFDDGYAQVYYLHWSLT